jgi:PhnB protein
VTHASLKLGDATVMLGSPGPDFRNPEALGGATQNLYVDVEDVDRHYERAREAGATIIEEPTDTFYGARRCGAEDPEGHQWYFAEELTDEPRPGSERARENTEPRSRTAGKRASTKVS